MQKQKKSESLGKFKAQIMRFIKVHKRSTFNMQDSIDIRISTKLRLGVN